MVAVSLITITLRQLIEFVGVLAILAVVFGLTVWFTVAWDRANGNG